MFHVDGPRYHELLQKKKIIEDISFWVLGGK